MTLPVIGHPLFDIKIPSTDNKVKFRPFLVKEEKILLIAQQSGEEPAIIQALQQIINNCAQDPSFDVTRLPYFDLEYVFLKLRARSVSNVSEFNYTDEEGNVSKLKVNLDDIEIEVPTDLDPIVWIDKEAGVGIVLRFPSVADTMAFKDTSLDADTAMNRLVESCIQEVFDKENVYLFSDYTDELKTQWIDSLGVPAFTQIQEFYDKMPVLRHTFSFTPKGKEPVSITLEGLSDFFSWG